MAGEEDVEKAIAGTQAFLGELYKAVSQSAEAGESLKQAYDKAMAALPAALWQLVTSSTASVRRVARL